MSIYPSSLAVTCPRHHWRLARKLPGERIFYEDTGTEDGAIAEEAIVSALTSGARKYTSGEYELSIPAEMLGRQWEVQKRIEFTIDDIGISGYADLYCPEANWVVDVKNSYDMSCHRWRWQLAAYAYPFWKPDVYGDIPPRVSIFFARWGVLADIDLPSREALERRVRMVARYADQETEPKPQGGMHCRFCPYAPSCPGSPHIDMSPEDALREIVRLEAKLEALRDNLKAYISIAGAVEADGMIAQFSPTTELQVSPELPEVLKSLGIDPIQSGIYTPNRTKIRQMVKKNEDLTTYISEIVKGTRFTIKEAKNETEN